MARRRRKSPLRWLLPLGAAAIIAVTLWTNRQRVEEMLHVRGTGAAATHGAAATDGDGKRVHVSGKLEAEGPARDIELGVSANAGVLIRKVEMFQWRERCSDDDCSYATVWSQQPVDSRRFRHRDGHDNPPPRLRDAVFAAPGLRVAALAVSAELVATQAAATDFKVHASDLPANLAASFSDADGALYAGGDVAHPQVGEVRVSYRIVPTGNVELDGVQHGGAVAAQ
jgi:hypothetical protein